MSRFLSRSRESIRELQLKLLREQMRYCADQVPYYSEQFRSLSFDAGGIQDLIQLQRLPLLDKATVREQQEQFRGARYLGGGVQNSFSSGSTGEPFASYFDKMAWLRKKYIIKLRARFACGMGWRQKVAILECEDTAKVAERNRKSWLTDAVLPVRVFSLFQNTESLLKQLRDYQPENIYAYPSHLFELASAADGGKPLLPSVKRLFTSSEFLEAGTRAYVEEKFAAPIYDHYGSTEFKEIAWQCPAKNWYHTNYDELICEVVDEQGAPLVNEPGHIVMTDLRNKAMPLIRFKLGDIGVLTNSPCSCGFRGDSIKPLGGRASDYIQTPSGEMLSPFRFTTEIEYLDGLIHYQLLQHAPDQLSVHTVWRNEPQLAEVEAIIGRALGEHARAMTLRAEAVESIANEANGKFKVVKRLF